MPLSDPSEHDLHGMADGSWTHACVTAGQELPRGEVQAATGLPCGALPFEVPVGRVLLAFPGPRGCEVRVVNAVWTEHALSDTRCFPRSEAAGYRIVVRDGVLELHPAPPR